MPKIITHALDVLHRVDLEMGGYYAHYDRHKVSELIAQAQQQLQTLPAREDS